jgi:hypothetical protein
MTNTRAQNLRTWRQGGVVWLGYGYWPLFGMEREKPLNHRFVIAGVGELRT